MLRSAQPGLGYTYRLVGYTYPLEHIHTDQQASDYGTLFLINYFQYIPVVNPAGTNNETRGPASTPALP